jgi:hypothetical protein
MDPNVLTCYKSPFNKIRLGKNYDGGYIIIDVPNINYNLFLSGGINNDISFEKDFIEKFSSTKCYAYDGTIDKLPEEYEKIQFIKKNIGDVNNDKITNLHDKIDSHTNIFLKMDIEGGEISWINSLSDRQINKFEQIVIEFHNPFSEKEIEVFNKLNKNHYLVHFHGNNSPETNLVNHKGIEIPIVFECTYLHKKYFIKVPTLNTDIIPSDIDMPNNSTKPDIVIDYLPFVYKEKEQHFSNIHNINNSNQLTFLDYFTTNDNSSFYINQLKKFKLN